VSLTALMNQACTVIRRETSVDRDDYGDEIREEVATATVCELQQTSSTEPGDEVAETSFRVFLPATTNIDQDDSIVIDGHTYEVTGVPDLVRNPRTKADSHIEVAVRRAAGADDTGS
jgi:hypothetical protein